jgi:hypothetical protein
VTERASLPFLPYSYVVGQEEVRQLLAVAYIMGSSVGGVLISGERGAAKSTIVRSFANMMYNDLPVTLPVNATDDRVEAQEEHLLRTGVALVGPGFLVAFGVHVLSLLSRRVPARGQR